MGIETYIRDNFARRTEATGTGTPQSADLKMDTSRQTQVDMLYSPERTATFISTFNQGTKLVSRWTGATTQISSEGKLAFIGEIAYLPGQDRFATKIEEKLAQLDKKMYWYLRQVVGADVHPLALAFGKFNNILGAVFFGYEDPGPTPAVLETWIQCQPLPFLAVLAVLGRLAIFLEPIPQVTINALKIAAQCAAGSIRTFNSEGRQSTSQ